MADNPVRTTSSVPGFSGYPGRSSSQPQGQLHKRGTETPTAGAADRVEVTAGATIALQLLRQRVLARTRMLLELEQAVTVPNFAEVLDGEPVPAFLGRLLSAQNQLAACRTTAWPPERLRSCLADAMLLGADETIELLAADAHASSEAIDIVAEVVQQFSRRLAAAEPVGSP